MAGEVAFELDGRAVAVPDDGCSLLEALRDRLAARSPKDGCSPQGQCGCCTVLVDGAARVACVTPVARVAGRMVTTVEGLPATERDAWADAFCATGASQCGFCTPGIIVRLHALAAKAPIGQNDPRVAQALLAHLCRCTGWRTILDAAQRPEGAARDLAAASARASLETGGHQAVAPAVALGRGGFADDTAPPDALVAVRRADGEWCVAETLTEARRLAGKVQGRRTTAALRWPIEVPPGDWVATLQTTWVEPAYLEPDASWCEPGGDPVSPLANGGAFGAKTARPTEVESVARQLADEHGRPVRVLWSREDVVQRGPKRPPLAGGIEADGTGIVRVARTPGIAAAISEVAPRLRVEEVDVPGPHTSAALRAAGWAEALALRSAVADADLGPLTATDPRTGATATAELDATGAVHVRVAAGDPLDATVLRSYAIGAAHQALGWVRSEGISVDADGVVHDLTIRSFGVLRATDTPPIHVDIAASDADPVRASDAVFAAVAAATWRHDGRPPRWPARR